MLATARRAAIAALAVATALAVSAPPAEARTPAPRRPAQAACTTTLVYEQAGTDADGPFIDRAYKTTCGGQTCTYYYTSRDGGLTWRLVLSSCTTQVVPRRA